VLPVRHGFNEEWSILTDWHFTSGFHGIVHGEYISAVYTDST